MRGAIVGLLLLLLVGYLGVKIGAAYSAKHDLEDRVEHYLDVVDDHSRGAVTQDLISDAAKLGIELSPENVHIVYEDTKRLSLPQKLVGERIAEFTNKQVGISVHYVAHIVGFSFAQDITRDKIRQVAAPREKRNAALEELLK